MHAHYESAAANAAHEAQEELQAEWESENAQATPRCYFPEEMQIDRNDSLAVNDETPQQVIDAMADQMVERELREMEEERAEIEEEDDGDEYDEPRTPKEAQIKIVVFRPGMFPQVRTIDNRLDEMQKLVGGLIEVFPVGVAGAIGVCNEDFIGLQLPPNRRVRAAGSVICGTFFVAGDGYEMSSLSDRQIADVLRAI